MVRLVAVVTVVRGEVGEGAAHRTAARAARWQLQIRGEDHVISTQPKKQVNFY